MGVNPALRGSHGGPANFFPMWLAIFVRKHYYSTRYSPWIDSSAKGNWAVCRSLRTVLFSGLANRSGFTNWKLQIGLFRSLDVVPHSSFFSTLFATDNISMGNMSLLLHVAQRWTKRYETIKSQRVELLIKLYRYKMPDRSCRVLSVPTLNQLPSRVLSDVLIDLSVRVDCIL